MIESAQVIQNSGTNNKRSLPTGWRWVKLGEVCIFLDSKRIPVSEFERTKRIRGKSQEDLFPYYGANGQTGWIDEYIFDEPLILLAEDGGNFGSKERPISYRVTGKCWVNNHAHVLHPLTDVIDFDYCYYMLCMHPDVGDIVSGSTRAKLNQNIASGIPIPLPPLPEQKRIVAILNEQLSEVEKARLTAETQLESANALNSAYLREIFNSPESQTWEKKMLKDVIVEARPGFACGTRDTKGVVQLRMNNVTTDGSFDWSSYIRIPAESETIKKYKLQSGDVLFNNTNSTELVGKTVLFESYPEKVVYSNHFTRLRTNNRYLLPQFLSLWIQLLWQQGFFAGICNRWIGQSAVKSDKLLSLKIPLPSIEKQNKLSSELYIKKSSVVILRNEVTEQLKIVNSLPNNILNKAFNGEL